MEKINVKKCFLVTIVLFSLFLLVGLTEVNASSVDGFKIEPSFKKSCNLTQTDMGVIFRIDVNVKNGEPLTTEQLSYLSRFDFNQDATLDSNDATTILKINSGLGVGRELNDMEKAYVLRLVNETMDADTIIDALNISREILPEGYQDEDINITSEGLEQALKNRDFLGKVSEQLCEDYSTILTISAKIGAGEALTPKEMASLSKLDVNMDGTINRFDISERCEYLKVLKKAKQYNIEESVVKQIVLSDFNNNNKIEANEAETLLKIIIGCERPVEGITVNGDGSTDIIDVLTVNKNFMRISEILESLQ